VLLQQDGDADHRERDEYDAHRVTDHLVGLLVFLLELVHVCINAHRSGACAPSQGGTFVRVSRAARTDPSLTLATG
jgi:hypothetical protein